MKIVSDYLYELIANQIDEKRMVVWFDPEKDYSNFIDQISIPDVKIISYEDSIFKLRHSLDSLINDINEDVPPRILVYIPLRESDTFHALAEITESGVVMKPGQHPWQLNTRLSVVVKGALREKLDEETITDLQKKIDGKMLNLEELNTFGENVSKKKPGVLKIIFGTSNPLDISLMFINNDDIDEKIQEKDAIYDIQSLIQDEFGIDLFKQKSITEIKEIFVKYLLSIDFIESINKEIIDNITIIDLPHKENHIKSCLTTVNKWRSTREYSENYIEHARRIENEIYIEKMELSYLDISNCYTFYKIENLLQSEIEKLFVENQDNELFDLIEIRKKMIWADIEKESKMRWYLIELAGQIIKLSNNSTIDVQNNPSSLKEYIFKYVDGENPWCLIDTYHRRMEKYYNLFELSTGPEHESLRKLINKARQSYMSYGSTLTKGFITSISEDGNRDNILNQIQIYERFVKSSLKEGKTAYFMIDALRYEMAKELSTALKNSFNIELNNAIGNLPTITKIGMAALLPDAEKAFKLRLNKKKMLTPYIGENALEDRKSRMIWISKHAGQNQDDLEAKVIDVKLEDVIDIDEKTIDKISDADLIVVTSQEIDLICETGDTLIARTIMDDILNYIARAARNLAKFGINNIIITSDHGFIFGDEIESDMKIEPPGGKQIELHRRAWIGVGGTEDPAYIRFEKEKHVDIDDVDIAVPLGFGVFISQGGLKSYFHGGMSPQEIIIPILILKSKQKTEIFSGPIIWDIKLKKEKITTRTATIEVTGRGASLEISPCKIRVEVKENDDIVAEAFGSTYGFNEDTKEIQLRIEEGNSLSIEKNEINIVFFRDPKSNIVNISIIDVEMNVIIKNIKKVRVEFLK